MKLIIFLTFGAMFLMLLFFCISLGWTGTSQEGRKRKTGAWGIFKVEGIFHCWRVWRSWNIVWRRSNSFIDSIFYISVHIDYNFPQNQRKTFIFEVDRMTNDILLDKQLLPHKININLFRLQAIHGEFICVT